MNFAFNPAKTTASSFFTPASTATTASSFTFGASVPSTTTASAFTFGTPATATSLFGAAAPAATTAPAFSFGTPATTSAPAFAFGTPLGSTASTAGATAARPAFTGFGTAAPASTAGVPLFAFGAASSAPAPAPFGFAAAPTTTTAPTAFPFASSTGFTTQPTAFPTTQPFGTVAPVPQQQQQPTVRIEDMLITALTSPRVFNDERDELILKWNILQVFYGTGKTFSYQGECAVDENIAYHVFKTYSYSVRPRTRDEDGLVALIIKEKISDVIPVKDKIVESLHRLFFNNNPNCLIELEGIAPLADDRTQMLIVVSEKLPGMVQVKKAKASDVVNHLQPPQGQPGQATLLPTLSITAQANKQHLDSMGIVQVFARTDLTEQEYKQYLDTIPPGLTAFVWEQAKSENPNPQLLLPVPLIGVKALRDRMRAQFIEHEDQKQQLITIRQQLRSVKDQCETFRLTMKRYQTSLLEYSHRILKATVQFECRRRQQEPKMTSTEIQIWSNLSPIVTPSSSSTSLDIRVKDLIMQLRLNPSLLAPVRWSSVLNSDQSKLGKEKIDSIKDILQDIHRGIKNIVEIVQSDRQTLTKIDERFQQRK